MYLRRGSVPYVAGPPLLDGRCTSLLRVVVSEMTYTVSSGTLNSTIPYHTLEELTAYSGGREFAAPSSRTPPRLDPSRLGSPFALPWKKSCGRLFSFSTKINASFAQQWHHCDVIFEVMFLQTVTKVVYQFLRPKFIEKCSRLLPDGAAASAKSMGICAHCTCLNIGELSANYWNGTMAT